MVSAETPVSVLVVVVVCVVVAVVVVVSADELLSVFSESAALELSPQAVRHIVINAAQRTNNRYFFIGTRSSKIF